MARSSPNPSTVDRGAHVTSVLRLLREFPVVGLLGPRQVGKTTLARQVGRVFKGKVRHFDLEDPAHAAELDEAGLALRDIRGLVVLDEIQRRPNLFPLLRVLADRRPLPARFLVLGSAAPESLRQSAESLAGRIHYHELGGFSLTEVGAERMERLWLRGGFPLAYIAKDDDASWRWRESFVRAQLESELPALGVRIASTTLRRFWTMLAHYHGQTWNGSELARAFGVSDVSVRRYLDVLTATFLVRQLQPWNENLSKRQVKAPKVFVTDSGILHHLLGIRTWTDLHQHPKVGASWEGFIVNELLEHTGAERGEAHFWGTYGGAELDLFLVRGKRRLGFDIKRTESPSITPSMRSAMEDLRLERLDVIHAGQRTFPLAERIRAVAASRILEDVEEL